MKRALVEYEGTLNEVDTLIRFAVWENRPPGSGVEVDEGKQSTKRLCKMLARIASGA